MTEAKWQTSDEGYPMLELVRARLTDGQLGLFMAAYPDQVTQGTAGSSA